SCSPIRSPAGPATTSPAGSAKGTAMDDLDHTVTAVDAELGGLAHAVAAMGDLAVAQVRAAVDVFARHDLDTAAKVVRADDALDIQDAEIEKAAVRFIALRQPVADDLRRPIAAMKIAM